MDLTRSRIPREAQDRLEAFVAAAGPEDWAELVEKVKLNDVGPAVHLGLLRTSLAAAVPKELVAAARGRYDAIAARNRRRWREARELFAALRGAGVDVILLKGGYFAEALWGDPGYKKMNDLDILIPAAGIKAALGVYRARGYLPLVLFEGGDPEAIDPAKTHHLPSFVSADFEFVLGTHWDLVSAKSGIRLDVARIWRDAVPLDFHGVELRRMSAEDNLHHLAVHFHHYKTGVKELSDIWNYAAFAAPVDWDRLLAMIRAAGSASRAYYCLSLADAIEPLGAPEAFFAALRAEADDFRRAEVDLRLSRLDLLLASRSLWEAEIEKSYTRYMLEPWFHRKAWFFLQFFRRLVLPPPWVLARTNVVDRVTPFNLPWLLLVNLRRTARVIGEGVGVAIFGLVMVKGLLETLASLVHYVRPPPPGPLEALEAAAGGDRGKLMKLMEFLD